MGAKIKRANPVCWTGACLRCAAIVVVSLFCMGADWPQWRGPTRDGHAPWLKLAEQGIRNLPVRWQVDVGQGYSGPVVAGERVYIHERVGERERIRALSRADGRDLWSYSYPAPYEMHPAARAHGPGPKATPTVRDGYIWAYGISSILTCLDAQTGRLIWQVDMKRAYGAAPAEYGTAASPLVTDRIVVVPVGGEQGSVMAFDRRSGRRLWAAVPGEMAAYSSPMLFRLAGVDQVVTFTERQFVGLEPNDGELLWSYRFTTPYRQNIVTPIALGADRVLAAGVLRYAFALQVRHVGEGLVAKELWKNRDLPAYMSSPVRVGGYAYGLGRRRQFVCVNLADGSTCWQGGGFTEYCSIVAAGEKLLVMDASGVLYVLRADPRKFQIISRWRVSDTEVWAHIAVTDRSLFVRNRGGKLICFDLAPAIAESPSASASETSQDRSYPTRR